MPTRLRLPYIEQKPKTVEFLDPLPRTVILTAEQERFLISIIRAISEGRHLPRGAYRTSVRRDDLLETLGVMHLHLGHSGSDELIYLVQYPNHVSIIEIGSHYHFTTRPIGGKLALKSLRDLQENKRRRALMASLHAKAEGRR